MGFSTVAATAIIGVSLLVAVEVMVSTTIPSIEDTHDSYDKLRDRSIEQVQTDINITKASAVSNASNWDVNISVENSGSITLDTSKFNVIMDGENTDYEIEAGYIFPENTGHILVYNFNSTSQTRIKVVTGNGISDYFEIDLGG